MNRPPEFSAAIREEFRATLRGEIRNDPPTLGAYATDAGIYQFMPLAVVEPIDRNDAIAAVRLCAKHQLPILPRGGGTSLAGQPLGNGVVIDLSRHLHRILALDPENRRVCVEPGIVRDELNRALLPYPLHFAPDPATSSRANIGGMIATNAAGMRSLRYGMTIDHLETATLVLATGDVITLGPVQPEECNHEPANLQNRIEQAVCRIITREHDEILARFPKVPRRSGGYPLDAFTGPPPWNLAKLIAGSEGTLGLLLDATLRLEPLPRHSGLCLAHFPTLDAALRAVAPIVEHQPSAVELLDGLILRQAREHPLTRDACAMIRGEPEAVLIIEFRHDDPDEVHARLLRLQAMLLRATPCAEAPLMQTAAEIRAVWTMRESALGLINAAPGDRKPIPYIEDAAVPLPVLPDYAQAVLDVCVRHRQPVAVFAHAGVGLLHFRPRHDLRDRAEIDQMLRIQDEVFALVQRFGGSWSGEHGDGIIRGGYNRAFFGERIFRAFEEVKHAFDPEGRMNPGKILHPPPRDANLRDRADPPTPPVDTAFHWREEGGWLRAAGQCTGVGVCRQLKTGVMCPSYMATRDEVHSTRGRANILRLALSGQLGPDPFQDPRIHEILDWCLGCKGCRSECPNRVDVGKMKAEFLYQHVRRRRRPLRMQLFGNLARLGATVSGPLAPAVNVLLRTHGVRHLLDKLLGIDHRRCLPRFAAQPFSRWFAARRAPDPAGRPVVALFGDLYTEYHEPEIGRAAVRVLEAAGYHIELIGRADSQRPALSLGMLDAARRNGEALIARLLPYAERNLPILMLEPSCATALIQDLPDLVADPSTARAVAQRVELLDAFLERELAAGHCRLPLAGAEGLTVFHHPHCHQRSLGGRAGAGGLLKRLEGATLITSEAGCCGMAGAFGYEKKNYDLSVTVANDRLVPALGTLPDDALIAASGFSCRHQIADLTGRPAHHPIQIIERYAVDGANEPVKEIGYDHPGASHRAIG